MQNITVRSSLMGVLCIFSLMILLGAAISVLALGQANRSTLLVHQIATQVIAINDAYKDTTRTRSALTRAYSELKEKGEQADLSALANAQTTYQRTLDTLTAFGGAAAFAGQDDGLKAGLLASGKQLSDDLSGALSALRARDTAAYIEINNKKITPDGAAFSSQLEKFQKLSNQLADGLVAEREADYRRVIGLMVAGLVAALVLVVAVHVMLKRVVLAPLNRAVALLEQVAQGNLTMRIAASGRNEIGLLLAAIRLMQQGLLDTVSRVRTGSDLINTGAHEIAAGNLDLSARTETQASSLEQTAASMEELTATVRRNADSAVEAHQLAQAASGTARKGSAVMGEMAGIMGAIDASSRKIVDIISLIDGIAFQTNILALNAAVEAARAGEQGRGFAVVATEVRNLAQRSAVAAKEIKVLIDASASQIDAGSKLAGQAGATMGEVVESVQRVTSIVTEIAHASSEQRDGIEQVNQAVLQMDQVTQQNAALVEQAAAAAQSLHTQAAALADTVSIFQINAADQRGTASSAAPNRRLTPF